jgi:hypothetical protein
MSHLHDSSHTLVLNSGQRPPAELDFGPQQTPEWSQTIFAKLTTGDRARVLAGARGDLR